MVIEDTIYNFRKELETLGYSKGVIYNYPKYVQQLLNYCKKSSTKITTEDIKEYHIFLETSTGIRTKKRLSSSHIHSIVLAIKSYFDYLQRTEYITQNPFNLKLKSVVTKERSTLSKEEIQELYNACETLQETAILHLAYGCGLRRMEIENLTITDINFTQKLLYVRKAKGEKRRVIPITETIAEELNQLRIKNEKLKDKDNQALLLNKTGTKMRGDTIYKIFKKLLKKLALSPKISLHHLRHSIATHLLENGMELEMVRDFLGHNQLSTTQIYTHINQRNLKELNN